MSELRRQLVLLVELQKIYNRIAEAIRERQMPPPEVKELQEENRQRESDLAKLEAQVTEHGDELVQVRKREDEWRLELEHFQKQKAIVSNEREFTAVISEIDYATKAINEAAGRRQELDTAIAELNHEIEVRRATRPEEEASHRHVVDDWEHRKQQLKENVHDLAREARAIEDELAPKNRARFLRLLESKGGTAMAAVVDGSCSMCHISVRPHLQQRVRRCEELICCEHCQRILFVDEALVELDHPATPG